MNGILIIPLIIFVIVPILFPFFTYTTVCGLAIESLLLQRSSAINMISMMESIQESTMDETKSESDQDLSIKLDEESIAEANQSEEFQTKALILKEKSEAEEIKSMNDKKTSEVLYEKATEEHSKEADFNAKAAMEESIYDVDMAEGDADAADTRSYELYSDSDTIASTVCNMIPFLDIVCDIVGAAAEFGMKSAEASSAAASIAAYAAANSAKNKEEMDLKTAAEEEARAEADTILGDEYESQATLEEEQAEKDEAESEIDQKTSNELLTNSQTHEKQSIEKKSLSTMEEMDSERSWTEAIKFGVLSTSYAILSILSSSVVLLFSSHRVLYQTIQPNTMFLHHHFKTRGIQNGFSSLWILTQQKILRIIIHCLLFISTFLSLNIKWKTWNQYSITTKGGIITLFAICLGFIHALVFTYLDCKDANQYNHPHERYKHIAYLFLITSIFYIPFLLIETLILLITFDNNDHGAFDTTTTKSKCFIVIALYIIFILMIYLHNKKVWEEDDIPIVKNNALDEEMALKENTNSLDYTFQEISLVKENETSEIVYDISNDFKTYIYALELPISILLLTLVIVIFTRHIPVTMKGLKPMYHYVLENFKEKIRMNLYARKWYFLMYFI